MLRRIWGTCATINPDEEGFSGACLAVAAKKIAPVAARILISDRWGSRACLVGLRRSRLSPPPLTTLSVSPTQAKAIAAEAYKTRNFPPAKGRVRLNVAKHVSRKKHYVA